MGKLISFILFYLIVSYGEFLINPCSVYWDIWAKSTYVYFFLLWFISLFEEKLPKDFFALKLIFQWFIPQIYKILMTYLQIMEWNFIQPPNLAEKYLPNLKSLQNSFGMWKKLSCVPVMQEHSRNSLLIKYCQKFSNITRFLSPFWRKITKRHFKHQKLLCQCFLVSILCLEDSYDFSSNHRKVRIFTVSTSLQNSCKKVHSSVSLFNLITYEEIPRICQFINYFIEKNLRLLKDNTHSL